MSLHRPCRLHCGSLLLARVRPIEPRGVKLLAHDEARRIAANIAKLLSCSAARLSSRDLVDGRRGWRRRGIFSARSLPRVFAIGLAGRIIGADSLNKLLPRVVQCVAE